MIYTVGHSRHPIDVFIKLLDLHEVHSIIDVRSLPRSRFCPQFNRAALSEALEDHYIPYLYLGGTLGGFSHLKDGDSLYDRDIQRVVSISKSNNVALMCSEGSHLKCHRGFKLTPTIANLGHKVVHISPTGLLIPNQS